MVSYARCWRRESHSMLPITREWVAKAESDYDGACEALRSRKESRRDRICFFSQQCIEKYLKARLVEARISFPRTHELSILLQLCLPIEPLWATFERALAAMTQFALLVRYPGTWATLTEARHGIYTCRRYVPSHDSRWACDRKTLAVEATVCDFESPPLPRDGNGLIKHEKPAASFFRAAVIVSHECRCAISGTAAAGAAGRKSHHS